MEGRHLRCEGNYSKCYGRHILFGLQPWVSGSRYLGYNEGQIQRRRQEHEIVGDQVRQLPNGGLEVIPCTTT